MYSKRESEYQPDYDNVEQRQKDHIRATSFAKRDRLNLLKEDGFKLLLEQGGAILLDAPYDLEHARILHSEGAGARAGASGPGSGPPSRGRRALLPDRGPG